MSEQLYKELDRGSIPRSTQLWGLARACLAGHMPGKIQETSDGLSGSHLLFLISGWPSEFSSLLSETDLCQLRDIMARAQDGWGRINTPPKANTTLSKVFWV